MIQRFYAWYTVIYQFKRIFALFTGELSHNVCNTITSISKESDISTKETYMCHYFLKMPFDGTTFFLLLETKQSCGFRKVAKTQK